MLANNPIDLQLQEERKGKKGTMFSKKGKSSVAGEEKQIKKSVSSNGIPEMQLSSSVANFVGNNLRKNPSGGSFNNDLMGPG